MKKAFEKSTYLNLFETYGYIETRKLHNISKDGVQEKLHELAEIEAPQKEERILLKIQSTGFVMEQVYLVNPVFMSLIIEDYECTEKLLDMGYRADDRFLEDQIYMICKNDDVNQAKEYKVSITQWIFAKENVPKHIVERICEELGSLRPVFEFGYDYWKNPFLLEDLIEEDIWNCEENNNAFALADEINDGFGNVIRKDWSFDGWENPFEPNYYPPLHGFQLIEEIDWELLEGMLEGDTLNQVSLDVDEKLFQKWFQEFIQYFEGMEDMEDILKFMSKETWELFPQTMDNYLKLLSKVKKVCGYNENANRACFYKAMKCLLDVNEMNQVYIPSVLDGMKKKLSRYIRAWYPEDYTIEDYMEFLQENLIFENVIQYIKIWKGILKQKWQPFWVDVVTLLDKYFENNKNLFKDDNFFRNKSAMKMKCISNMIEFVELLDDVSYDTYPIEEDIETFAYFIGQVIEIQSEELLMLCVEKNLIPQKFLYFVGETALQLNYTKLLPCVIYMQSEK